MILIRVLVRGVYIRPLIKPAARNERTLSIAKIQHFPRAFYFVYFY